MSALIRNNHGSVIVSFAIILLPLMGLVLTIIELFVALIAQTALDTRTSVAAHRLASGDMIGMSANEVAGQIEAIICTDGSLLVISESMCKATLKIGIVPITTATPMAPVILDGVINEAAFARILSQNGIMVVRTAIVMPQIFVNPFGIGNTISGHRMLISGFIARIDPYAEYNINGSSANPAF